MRNTIIFALSIVGILAGLVGAREDVHYANDLK
jgi:ABC-type uncharacterized transport system permease subunit